MTPLTSLPIWLRLEKHYQSISSVHMRALFAEDPHRFEHFSAKFNDILLDYSKNRINNETMTLLLELAHERELPVWIERMFSGEQINHTEQRAVLHTALRNRSDKQIPVDGQDVMPEVHEILTQMRTFADAVRTRQWRGYTGQPITDIVNIGVGGSDLGPVMATERSSPSLFETWASILSPM